MEPPQRPFPDDPVAFIQACVRGRRILCTYHVNVRLKGRFVSRETILDVRVITVCRPSPDEWENDLKTRRERQ